MVDNQTRKRGIILIATLSLLLTFLFYYKNVSNLNTEISLIKLFESNQDVQETLYIQKEKLKQTISTSRYNQLRKNLKLTNTKGDKWIILTTINYPNEHVKYLHDVFVNNYNDWNLLVLGDKKTPKNWNYKRIVYLDYEKQIELAERYKIVHKIPANSYLRKMIGYLYAIDMGAEYIYETDDDNSPLDGLFGFRYKKFKGLESNCFNQSLFINPYSYFGQASLWPRGYPLEKIGSTECDKYKLYAESGVPLIQQGLVNGDPDVDAIYRLTRKSDRMRLDIKFDENAPALVLGKNQYAPINSQNTFYHYDSFWSLVFPLKVTFRECDILRGYISIRLLQEINGRVSFMAPNAVQFRNSHSFHKDYLEEKRLYESIQKFVKDLNDWKCAKKLMSECLLECVKYLIEKKHLNEEEFEFYNEWIEDLNRIGYKWPEIKRSKIKMEENGLNIIYKSVEQEHSSNSNENEFSLTMQNYYKNQEEKLKLMCSEEIRLDLIEKQISKMSNVLLVTMIQSQSDLEYFDSFINIHFPYSILCVSNLDKLNQSFLNSFLSKSYGYSTIHKQDLNFQDCISYATIIGYKQQAFLIVKNINRFQFWSNDKLQFKFLEPSINIKDEKSLEENIFFMRKNVGNGIRYMSLNSAEEIKNFNTYCKYFNENKQNLILSNLIEAIENLKWHSNDLASESCENVPQKTVWIPCFHDGPRVDISSTLIYLGQNPILAGQKKASSPYPEALKLSKISDQLSEFVLKYTTVDQKDLDDKYIKINFDYYKESSDFANVDIVICSFLASLCEAFIPLNKTVIFNPAHRYNIGRCTKDRWNRLNQNYYKLMAKNKIVVSAMSKYDAEYQEHFSGLKQKRLYAYGGYYARNIEYNPIRDEILVGPSNHMGRFGSKLLESLNSYANSRNYVFKHIRQVYPRYSLSQLANHRAIILFPYAVMSYSIIDFYISNIPLFIPSIEFLTKNKNLDDRVVKAPFYCGKIDDIEPHNQTIHDFSPNDDADEAYSYWLSYADYYVWPFVTVFESWEDLIEKLSNMNLKKISENMKAYNKIREADLLSNWCDIFKSVDKVQPIPKSFEEALTYFGMDRIQSS